MVGERSWSPMWLGRCVTPETETETEIPRPAHAFEPSLYPIRLCTAREHSPYLHVAYPEGEASLGAPKEEFGRMVLACIKALSKTLPNIHMSSHIPAPRLTSTSSCRKRRLNFAVPKGRFFQKSSGQILPRRPQRESSHPGYATRPCNTAAPHGFEPSLYLMHLHLSLLCTLCIRTLFVPRASLYRTRSPKRPNSQTRQPKI